MTRPEHYQNKYRYAHLLKGSYIKPELTFVHYTADGDRWDGGSGYGWDDVKTTILNLAVVGGKQWVYHNSLLLDIYAGLGINLGDTDNYYTFHYAFTGDTVTLTGGIKIGFLF